jgi:molybdate transport system substrate-binding protein
MRGNKLREFKEKWLRFCFATSMGLTLVVSAAIHPAFAQTPARTPAMAIEVFSAGSLREALTAIAVDYENLTGRKLALTFGASGLLRERLETGGAADSHVDVFTSADMGHPQRLFQSGGWQAPVVFARNGLCALTQASLNIRSDDLLEVLLRADVRLGTSTPKADPAGDYAWALFQKAEALRPGAFATLEAKALKLVGAADSPKPPAGQGVYAWLMRQGQADIFLTYCTNAIAAQKEVPELRVLEILSPLQVGAAYGLTVRKLASDSSGKFADYLLSRKAQLVFERFGFGVP